MLESKSPRVANSRTERAIEETIIQAGLPVIRYELCLAEYERETCERLVRLSEPLHPEDDVVRVVQTAYHEDGLHYVEYIR